VVDLRAPLPRDHSDLDRRLDERHRRFISCRLGRLGWIHHSHSSVFDNQGILIAYFMGLWSLVPANCAALRH
jgi:hypothetical protein